MHGAPGSTYKARRRWFSGQRLGVEGPDSVPVACHGAGLLPYASPNSVPNTNGIWLVVFCNANGLR